MVKPLRDILSINEQAVSHKATWDEFKAEMNRLGGIRYARGWILGAYKRHHHKKNTPDSLRIWTAANGELERRKRYPRETINLPPIMMEPSKPDPQWVGSAFQNLSQETSISKRGTKMAAIGKFLLRRIETPGQGHPKYLVKDRLKKKTGAGKGKEKKKRQSDYDFLIATWPAPGTKPRFKKTEFKGVLRGKDLKTFVINHIRPHQEWDQEITMTISPKSGEHGEDVVNFYTSSHNKIIRDIQKDLKDYAERKSAKKHKIKMPPRDPKIGYWHPQSGAIYNLNKQQDWMYSGPVEPRYELSDKVTNIAPNIPGKKLNVPKFPKEAKQFLR